MEYAIRKKCSTHMSEVVKLQSLLLFPESLLLIKYNFSLVGKAYKWQFDNQLFKCMSNVKLFTL